MRAVVYKEVGHVIVEDVPVPEIQTPTDAIVKVTRSGLCGSDLHFFKGYGPIRRAGFIAGHEVVGFVSEIGSDVKNFKVGDHVVLPFSSCCGNCHYCSIGQSWSCVQCEFFGEGFDGCINGGQAEYIRVPLAPTTLFHAPSSIAEDTLLLMADIFPTGYHAASRFLKNVPEKDLDELTVAVVGCGPVGMCALASAIHLTQGRAKVFAIDRISARLDEAMKIGAIPLNLDDNPEETIKKASKGRGADVVIEVVGHNDALQLCIDTCRPGGKISSIGVFGSEMNLHIGNVFDKGLTMSFGCCPVRSLFEEALEVLVKTQDSVKSLCGVLMPLENAVEAYELFNQRKVHKIIFTLQ
ncbi:chaperonin 10-like protein [Boeremia exigua]|uniref:chaperonin 10-like protein n=1 Tax=Boeremia exigua TaxID=749465 RepID=UPI001E8EC024|nr:chaperonin 10-like protein [Boeremia exigua]KAH6628986.1 chaperonin 10-like protein [Boeremia exigua]